MDARQTDKVGLQQTLSRPATDWSEFLFFAVAKLRTFLLQLEEEPLLKPNYTHYSNLKNNILGALNRNWPQVRRTTFSHLTQGAKLPAFQMFSPKFGALDVVQIHSVHRCV